jgi:hypothetical protein
MRKILGFLAGLLLLPSIALAIPAIVFDTIPDGAGGTMTYDGAGGPLIATDIRFVEIAGDQTPLNAGLPLACVNCLLDFTTGANMGEGPPLWTWDGGGSFVLTGDVPALGLVGATLIAGTFTATANTPGLVGGEDTALFISLGVDSKDPVLASFYGLSPTGFQFANTEIALGTFTPGADGAFSAIPNQADIINVALVPVPATVILVGLGLLALGAGQRKIGPGQ